MLDEKTRAALNAPLPASDVAQREGAGRKQLSYVEHFRVVALLNEIIGNGAWSTSLLEMRELRCEEIDGEKGKRFAVAYLARVRLHGDGWAYEDVGFGSGLDRDIGAAHESASKEAVSDAEKRCARHLGWRVGLALYQKPDERGGREHVEPPPLRRTPDEVRQDVERMLHDLGVGTADAVEEARDYASKLRDADLLSPGQTKALAAAFKAADARFGRLSGNGSSAATGAGR